MVTKKLAIIWKKIFRHRRLEKTKLAGVSIGFLLIGLL